MITVSGSGSFHKTESFLNSMQRGDAFALLDSFGRAGVDALAAATPQDSGLTAASWVYEVERKRGRYSITWRNTNVHDGAVIAILIQYGHGTGTGGYIQGRDYINPAIQPLFDKIADAVWEQVRNG